MRFIPASTTTERYSLLNEEGDIEPVVVRQSFLSQFCTRRRWRCAAIVAVVAVLLILALSLGLYFGLRNKSKSNNTEDTLTPTKSPETSTVSSCQKKYFPSPPAQTSGDHSNTNDANEGSLSTIAVLKTFHSTLEYAFPNAFILNGSTSVRRWIGADSTYTTAADCDTTLLGKTFPYCTVEQYATHSCEADLKELGGAQRCFELGKVPAQPAYDVVWGHDGRNDVAVMPTSGEADGRFVFNATAERWRRPAGQVYASLTYETPVEFWWSDLTASFKTTAWGALLYQTEADKYVQLEVDPQDSDWLIITGSSPLCQSYGSKRPAYLLPFLAPHSTWVHLEVAFTNGTAVAIWSQERVSLNMAYVDSFKIHTTSLYCAALYTDVNRAEQQQGGGGTTNPNNNSSNSNSSNNNDNDIFHGCNYIFSPQLRFAFELETSASAAASATRQKSDSDDKKEKEKAAHFDYLHIAAAGGGGRASRAMEEEGAAPGSSVLVQRCAVVTKEYSAGKPYMHAVGEYQPC